MGTRCADHVTPLYPQKLALTSSTFGGRSVGIVRVRTKATEFVCLSYRLSTCQLPDGVSYSRNILELIRSEIHNSGTVHLLELRESVNQFTMQGMINIYITRLAVCCNLVFKRKFWSYW